MGAVNEALYTVQHHAETCPMVRLHAGAQVCKHGLYLTPVHIGTNRAVNNRMQQIFVLVAHRNSRWYTPLQNRH